jgi:large conductance mechanosensitive channel protein
MTIWLLSEEFEPTPFLDFIEAQTKSANYQRYLGHGFTRSLVAMRAEQSSTRTVGRFLWQLFFGILATANAAIATRMKAASHRYSIPPKEARMRQGFKQFILRGNMLDLAVAVVMGGAFGVVVTALVKDRLTPFIAAVAGQPDFSTINFTVNGSKFLMGAFINAPVSFLLIAAAVYFFVTIGSIRAVSRSA